MKRALALVALLALSLASACGDDDSSDGEGAAASASSESAAVTIEHRFGTTELDSVPERIVSLDTQWTDVLVALDAPPVGAALDPQVEGGRYPWQADFPASIEGIEVSFADLTIPYEEVAALEPDLIVVSWAAEDESDYDQLSEIAPTIPLLGDAQVDQWQDMAATAGEFLQAPDEAEALIASTDQAAADVLAELPGLEGKTYAMANYVPGDQMYVVADPDDGAATLFAQLGMEIDPDLVAIADGASGRVELSLERIGELDADLLLLLTNGADPAEIPGYSALPAVQSGAVSILDLALATGINTPTPLSVPWALDALQPALQAAAA